MVGVLKVVTPGIFSLEYLASYSTSIAVTINSNPAYKIRIIIINNALESSLK